MSAQTSHFAFFLRLWIFANLQFQVGAFRVKQRQKAVASEPSQGHLVVTFKVVAETTFGERIRITGNLPCLGAWDPDRGLLMSTDSSSYPWWTSERVVVEAPAGEEVKIEYKYLRDQRGIGGGMEWEVRHVNREIALSGIAKNVIWIVEDSMISDNSSSTTVSQVRVRGNSAQNLLAMEGVYIPWACQSDPQKIGEGAFGHVYRLDTVWGIFAMKKTQLSRSGGESTEYRVHRAAGQNNIFVISVVQTYQPPVSGWQYEYGLLEFMDGGSLFRTWPIGRKTELPRIIFAQLLAGVAQMHQNEIVHRDLKLENLLVNKKECVDGTVRTIEAWILLGCLIKIADFGIGCTMGSVKGLPPCTRGKGAGTPHYASPEQFLNAPGSKAMDVWACGAILFELHVGLTPDVALFPNNPRDFIQRYMLFLQQQDYRKLTSPSVGFAKPPPGMREVLQNIFVVQGIRKSAEELLKHPYVAEMMGPVAEIRQAEENSMPEKMESYRAVEAEAPAL